MCRVSSCFRRQRLFVVGADRFFEQEFNLPVDAAQILLGPAIERLVESGIKPQQE